MMQIHVARNGKELGSFSLDEVRAGLSSGKFLPTDFCWTEGQSDWLSLSALPALAAPPAPLPKPSPEPAPEVIAAELDDDLPEPEEPGFELAVHEERIKQRALVKRPAAQSSNRPTSGLATASLVLGVLAVSAVPLLPAIPAIICGHLARARVRESNGEIGGEGAALCGLITGYLSLFLFVMVGAVIYGIAVNQGRL